MAEMQEEDKFVSFPPESVQKLMQLIKVYLSPKSTPDIGDPNAVNGMAVWTAFRKFLMPDIKTIATADYRTDQDEYFIDVTAYVYSTDNESIDPLDKAIDISFVPSAAMWNDDYIISDNKNYTTKYNLGSFLNCQIFPQFSGVKYTLQASKGLMTMSTEGGTSEKIIKWDERNRKNTVFLDIFYEHTPANSLDDHFAFTKLYRKASLLYNKGGASDAGDGRYYLHISKLRRSYISSVNGSSGMDPLSVNNIATGIAPGPEELERCQIEALKIYNYAFPGLND